LLKNLFTYLYLLSFRQMLFMRAKEQQYLVGSLVSLLLHMLLGTSLLGFFLKTTFLW